MRLTTQTLLASAASLLIAGSAFAGASLDTLLSGGTLHSENGELMFSDFVYTPILNAPEASDIEVLTLAQGLLFETQVIADEDTGDVMFDLAYSVTGQRLAIEQVYTQTTGSGIDGGKAEVQQVFTDMKAMVLAKLFNNFLSEQSTKLKSAYFPAIDLINVKDSVLARPGNGTASVSEITQTFDTSPVPSPTAALAGVAFLGMIGLRRRRAD